MEGKFLPGILRCRLFLCGLKSPSSHPEFPIAVVARFLPVELDKVGWSLMAPPKLPREAPIVDPFEPAEIIPLRSFWTNLNLAILDDLNCTVRQVSHPHPPLRLHERLNN